MNDRPSARELIDAVRHYLEAELLPTLTDARQRYQALIASNVLAIAGREIDADHDDEADALGVLLGVAGDVRSLNEQLCQRIRAGEFDPPERFAEAARVMAGSAKRKKGSFRKRQGATVQAVWLVRVIRCGTISGWQSSRVSAFWVKASCGSIAAVQGPATVATGASPTKTCIAPSVSTSR